VRCRPDYAFAVLLVNVVMEEATDGLEEKRTNNDYADSWMAVAGFKLKRANFRSLSPNGYVVCTYL